MEEEEPTENLLPAYEFPMKVGRFTLVELLGIGGMGEVFLAQDPVCIREVALKRILPEDKDEEEFRQRFKKEVKITAQLAHNAIIPIYELYEDEENLYYTMPYLKGENLESILCKSKFLSDKGLPPGVIGGSIPSLMQIFLNVCQAVEHSHSIGYIHRDLKPHNIMIGPLNEVTIIDWGLAIKMTDANEEEEEEEKTNFEEYSNPRGRAGTIRYMAPERAFFHPASIKTDIYSLGIILFVMLTLEVPYERPECKNEWRDMIVKDGPEPPLHPEVVAPDREITQQLSQITLKCLHPDPEKRYASVKDIIADLQRYFQGYPDWIAVQQFDLNKAPDWATKENATLLRQEAISRYGGIKEEASLVLSKDPYLGNIQLQTNVRLHEGGKGIGIVLCAPDTEHGLEKGFLIWVGSKENPGAKLFRNQTDVSKVDTPLLEPGLIYNLAVQRQDNVIRLLINYEQKFSYISPIPFKGGHFGIFLKDQKLDTSLITLSVSSQNALVNCLSIPDAFLLNGDFTKALAEYRRIAVSFKGRPEEWKAFFGAGITLIEQAKQKKEKAAFAKALEEFKFLQATPGAPIEYLGESLVHQAQNNTLEEFKCLEAAVQKFPQHPLRHMLDEHILFRLHETAKNNRIAAYRFALLTLRSNPSIYNFTETDRLIKHLATSWEDLSFIESPPAYSNEQEEALQLCIVLAFWLADPKSLYELIREIPQEYKHRLLLLENGLLSLLQMRYPQLIDSILKVNDQQESDPEFLQLKNNLKVATEKKTLFQKLDLLIPKASPKLLSCLFDQGLTLKEASKLIPYFEKTKQFESQHIWALLLAGKKRESGDRLKGKSIEDPSSIYFMLYGCYLALNKGESEALAHFDTPFNLPFPYTPTLLAHFLKGNINLEGLWFSQAFLWEKLQLYRQLVLYNSCLGNSRKAADYETLIEKEFLQPQISLDFI